MDFFKKSDTLKKEYKKKKRIDAEQEKLLEKLKKLKEKEKKEKQEAKKKIKSEVDKQLNLMIKKFDIYKSIKELLSIYVEQNRLGDDESIIKLNEIIKDANELTKKACEKIQNYILELKPIENEILEETTNFDEKILEETTVFEEESSK